MSISLRPGPQTDRQMGHHFPTFTASPRPCWIQPLRTSMSHSKLISPDSCTESEIGMINLIFRVEVWKARRPQRQDPSGGIRPGLT